MLALITYRPHRVAPLNAVVGAHPLRCLAAGAFPIDVDVADSTGRRNTLIMEVFGNGDGRLE